MKSELYSLYYTNKTAVYFETTVIFKFIRKYTAWLARNFRAQKETGRYEGWV